LRDTPPFFNHRIRILIRESEIMIIFFPVILKSLFTQGRNYPWPRPDHCPICHRYSVWGHGFAFVIFDGFNQPLPIKLYRCPDCGCVIRLRPEGHFPRFQAPIETIRSSITHKAVKNRWLQGIAPSRQRHWYNAVCKRIKAYLTDAWQYGVLAGFDYLLQSGQIPVSRSI
jgi:hypothetical protein